MDWAKWEISKNAKKYCNIIVQDIINCNIDICNPYYKDLDVGIKYHHCGTLPNIFTIHHLDCILEFFKTEVPISTKIRDEVE